MRRLLIVPAIAVLLAGLAAPAQAQFENRALYDRIERLERDLQMMQGQMARSGGSTVITSPALGGGQTVVRSPDAAPMPAGLAVRLDERVDELENMVRQLTGKIEEATFKAQQANKALERLQADIDARFRDLQGAQQPAAGGGSNQLSMPAAGGASRGAETPGGAPGPQVLGTMSDKDMKKLTPPQAANAAPKDAQGQYDDAYAAAQRGDFAVAEKGFQDFLSKNPNHQLAGNASYWLGDIAFSRKDFDTAARTFLEAYKTYPKHAKAPDMIYKAGSAFGQQGKKKEACVAFSILFKDHPGMADRVKRAAQAEKQKYECK
ncbi:conserved exported hypothetical protein [Magnetospirillum sp. LM-5]|uniref:tol-pal system protein YbgF n=1 Tax=Magnetospirillum sp. LM-5 TaxID=2681466 RepID=UPI00138331A3|nr:tol-pal system protein YbgF [Magnetospirillum sp. LM-5]CAA7612064.1 conserved exported hypothetical protein [Magnetospirillum sp. LM-5]